MERQQRPGRYVGMTESRQQRRARERAERKAATRPGLNLPPPPRRPGVADVELHRMVDDEDPTWMGWHAEWGIRGQSVGVEDSAPDLAAIVAGVLDDLRSYRRWDIVRIEWSLGGDKPPGQTVADAVAAAGVTLPNHL